MESFAMLLPKDAPRFGWVKPPKITTKCFSPVVLLQPRDPAASIFNGSIHLCIHCLPIPCQIGSEKDKPLKFFNKESPEWLQQAEQNVEKWKLEQDWFNQFAESTPKQNERWEAKKKALVESRDSWGIQETRTMGGHQYHSQQPVPSLCEERLGTGPS